MFHTTHLRPAEGLQSEQLWELRFIGVQSLQPRIFIPENFSPGPNTESSLMVVSLLTSPPQMSSSHSAEFRT